MLVKDCKNKIKIGDRCRTNGDLGTRMTTILEGEIREIQSDCFYIWQNEKPGEIGLILPVSYRYSWKILFDNPTATIEILRKVGSNKKISSIKIKMQKLTSSLKRILSPSLQKQYKAELRNGDLELTDEGKQELLELLAIEKEKELTEIAEEIIKESKEK